MLLRRMYSVMSIIMVDSKSSYLYVYYKSFLIYFQNFGGYIIRCIVVIVQSKINNKICRANSITFD